MVLPRIRPTRWLELLTWLAIAAVLCSFWLPANDSALAYQLPPPVPTSTNLGALAGDYYQGSPRGRYWFLRILGDGRYAFTWGTCTGVACRESGYAKIADSVLILTPTRTCEPRVLTALVPVPWGARLYLIPPKQMPAFRDAIIAGEEPRSAESGQSFVKAGLAAVDGLPTFPRAWSHLTDGILVGTIIDIRANRFATINLGANDGIAVGSVLSSMPARDQAGHRLGVIEVEKTTCLVSLNDPGEKKAPLKLGQTVITRRNAETSLPLPAPLK